MGYIIWLGCGLGAAYIASEKGRGGCLWLALGLVFGPLALLAAVAMSPDEATADERDYSSGRRIPCPACRESIDPDATICPHCRSELTRG